MPPPKSTNSPMPTAASSGSSFGRNFRKQFFDAQSDSVSVVVHDLDFYFVAFFQSVCSLLDPTVVDLADMNESVDSGFQFNECAERNESGDFALNNRTYGIFLLSDFGGLFLKLLIS